MSLRNLIPAPRRQREGHAGTVDARRSPADQRRASLDPNNDPVLSKEPLERGSLHHRKLARETIADARTDPRKPQPKVVRRQDAEDGKPRQGLRHANVNGRRMVADK